MGGCWGRGRGDGGGSGWVGGWVGGNSSMFTGDATWVDVMYPKKARMPTPISFCDSGRCCDVPCQCDVSPVSLSVECGKQ